MFTLFLLKKKGVAVQERYQGAYQEISCMEVTRAQYDFVAILYSVYPA